MRAKSIEGCILDLQKALKEAGEDEAEIQIRAESAGLWYPDSGDIAVDIDNEATPSEVAKRLHI